jgi:GNAT superfamily N-acetyltransferase
MRYDGPHVSMALQCERILRTLPEWFGIESALRDYAAATTLHPTFTATQDATVVAFLTAREHFPHAWEVHCFAVDREHRGRGVGRALHTHVEAWLAARSVRLLQVKTIADAHPSPAYAETRRFYARLGYVPPEVFRGLWGPTLPVLQLVKALSTDAA